MTMPTSNNNELLVEENSSSEGLPNIRVPKLQNSNTSNSCNSTTANANDTPKTCMNDRTKGLLVMMIGVLVISPDAVLTRFLSNGGSQPWTIIFWKMVFAVPVALGFAVYDAGGISKLSHQILYGKYYYPIVVPLQAAVDTCFTLAFVYTSAAKALLLINLNPLWCALAGRFLLGDVLPTRTYLALGLAFLCTLVIFVPELVQRNSNSHNQEDEMSEFDEGIEDVQFVDDDGALLGNVIALFTGLGLAAYITLVRHASTQNSPPVHLIGCTPLAAMLAALVALIVRKGDVLPESYWRIDNDDESSINENNSNTQYWQFWLASVAQGIAIGVIFICITIAPRLITGAEVGLCVLLEAVLGPLFVFLAYGDVPSLWTILGGSLLLVVLAVHEATPLFNKAQKTIRQSLANRRRRSQCLKEEQHHQHDLPLEVTITKPSNSTVEVESGESEQKTQ